MRLKRLCVFIGLIICFNTTIHGQNIKTSFDRINGLSQSTGGYIIQDKNGFIWIATFSGLNKYDGNTFKKYQHDENDSTSLSNDGTVFLFEDKEGYIWVLNNSSFVGIDRYDPTTDTFSHFTHVPEDSSSLSSNRVFHLIQDKKGDIWITTSNALNRLIVNENNGDISFEKYYYPPYDNYVSYIHEESDDQLLLISHYGYFFDKNTRQFTNANLNVDITLTTSVVREKTGSLLLGTFENGIKRLSFVDSLSSYREEPLKILDIGDNYRTFLTSDEKQNIWIGSRKNGLFRYNQETKKLEHFANDETDLNSMSENSVQSIFIDRTGVLWVGTFSKGLCKTDLYRKEFYSYKSIPGNPNSLSGNLISSIAGNHPNELWVGVQQHGGISRFIFDENEVSKVIRYNHDPENDNSIASDFTLSLTQRRNGDIWVGCVGYDITQIIPKDPDHASYEIIKRHKGPGWTFSIFEDSDSILWGGTWEAGLWRFDDNSKSFKTYINDPKDSFSLCDVVIWSIGEDQYKNLWIGGHGRGLSILPASEKSSEKPRFINFALEKGNDRSLSNNTLNVFYEDKNGTMWIGTNGGLNRVVVKEGDLRNLNSTTEIEFISYTVKDGLPSDEVNGIVEDEKGNLWLSTINGISMFDFSDSTFVNYFDSDGLLSNNFWHNAYFKNADGRIFFGGQNGFNAFYPNDIKANPFIPQLAFTDFYVWNEKVKVGQEFNNEVILPQSINTLDEIVLTYENNMFTIEFAALHFAQPHKNNYAYYLEGYEDHWIYTEGKRSVTYTNLDPENYIFKVKGSNNNGIWNEEGITLKIKILPPWWGTWWFRVLVLVSLIGVGLLVLYVRTKNLVAQKTLLEQKVEKRTIQLNKLVKELQEKQEEVEATNEELTSTLEDLFTQKDNVEKINLELRNTQKELRLMNSELDLRVQERTSKLMKANQELDRFVYSASHDLSAPLKSIIGLINIASLETKKNDLGNHLSHMEKSVFKLENVIKSLTQYSRNSGHELQKVEFCFNDLIHEVLDETFGLHQPKNIEIIREYAPQQIIKTDFLRLKIILSNLISNANKYRNTDKPDAYIKISFERIDNQNVIVVKDNGMGIDPDYKDKIFDMFFRATTQSDGSGLGLYIVKETVDKLKGRITVDSVKGEFTEVKVVIPV